MELDLQRYSVRTDLAVDAREMAGHAGPIPGVDEEITEKDGIKITRLNVLNEAGSQAIGRVKGHYITLEVPGLRNGDTKLQEQVAEAFAREFEDFLALIGIQKKQTVLIVGLGNWNVTPDSLGPLVVENVLVTRQYFQLMPDQVAPGYREISAIAPGVLGLTGIESSEIVQGIVERTKPDLIIAIDALASKSLERVNTTIQIADIGIHPGSGIGNKRRGLTKEVLGVPVVAIGVPTVCYASTIVNNVMEMMKNHFGQETNQTRQIMGMLDDINEQERLALVKEVLEPLGHDLIVTPKEIDEFIEDIANIVASGLNAALHDAVDPGNTGAYTH
ncbi:GPR endopeptidase [Paenibacillus cellulositrophicus]|uniref:Germination protease n=2 Tax=Paenibacillus TaxID=44249 RepID=A0A1R1EU50_9BACL|nr:MULTISPECIES: GPR endopeptidase [Paenibacillus]MBJ9988112.1 GPR endopeptidase [Paenibacillus sp. S28]MCM2999724.1 GPR endopeptidase [Paenibacillus cellulositrophicus]MEC0176021.1 GPR endopeptidase [Paenibacillus favisporus]OMF55376.1 GPR endopeptidase [Paenibacillus rhizosphaerae]OXL84981.1 GPR endopeptidase [Paenibacillus sp. SSG-1]